MRFLLLALTLSCAPGADVDAGAIVRRAVLNDEKQDAALPYLLTERSLTRTLEEDGRARPASSRTREIRMPDFQKRRERFRKAIREIPEAFVFRLLGEEQIDSRPAWVIEAAPRPGYTPADRYSKLFTQVRGKLWIDRSDYRWVKVEAELLDTVTFGWILVRIHQGSRARLTQKCVAPGVWLPGEMWYRVSVRIGLISLRHMEVAAQYGDYRLPEPSP
jgi:hypothetical protein